jgi:hypothetical protein
LEHCRLANQSHRFGDVSDEMSDALLNATRETTNLRIPWRSRRMTFLNRNLAGSSTREAGIRARAGNAWQLRSATLVNDIPTSMVGGFGQMTAKSAN